MIYTIHPIRMIRKTPNFLPTIAGIALMTITACGSVNLGDFSKATQDAAVATAVASATAEATAAAEAIAATAAQTAADTARTAQNTAVATARAEEKQIAQTAQDLAVATARSTARAEFECTTPVCDNVVNADDLPSFPTAVTSGASTFLTIVGTEIDAMGIRRGNADPIIHKATRADICEARGGDETTCAPTKNANNMDDGFQHFVGEFGGSNTLNFAGILPTTNLGAPLTAQPTNAAWPGFYSERTDSPVPLLFNIDFANRSITTEHAISVSALSFRLVFSDSGVISGAVLEHDLGTDTRIIGSRVATGLIGTEGLVGVFINASESLSGARYLGGFAANNPDTNP